MKIIHRCNVCGHPEEYHPFVDYGRSCRVSSDVIKQQPAELLLTLDGRGLPVETVTKPGSWWPGRSVTCDCEACQQLYREVAG